MSGSANWIAMSEQDWLFMSGVSCVLFCLNCPLVTKSIVSTNPCGLCVSPGRNHLERTLPHA